jgi:hypothetical protein
MQTQISISFVVCHLLTRCHSTLPCLFAANGNTDACMLLVKAGASTRVTDAQGQTPLQAAIAAGQQETVKFLTSVDQGPREKRPREESPEEVTPAPPAQRTRTVEEDVVSSPMQTDEDDDDEVEEVVVVVEKKKEEKKATIAPPKYEETPTNTSKAKSKTAAAVVTKGKAIAPAPAPPPPRATVVAPPAAAATPLKASASVSEAQLSAVRAVLFEAWRRDGDSTSMSAVTAELDRRRAANTLTADELDEALASLAHDNAVMVTSDGAVIRI